MAGTGHPFEVVNLSRVVEALAPFAEASGHPEGRAWFSSAHVLRHCTSADFVAPVEGEIALGAVLRHAPEGPERVILLSKLAQGADLRVFVPDFLTHLGPDFGHIADWMRSLPEGDPRMLRKLGRVTISAALTLADRWSLAQARKAARDGGVGAVEPFIAGSAGRLWVELRDEQALVGESAMMVHCVHSYGSALAAGTRFFSLRDRRGLALVTVEILPSENGPAARQIRARANQRPRRALVGDVVSLLSHLEVVEDRGAEAAAMGVVRDEDGRWVSIDNIAERVELDGLCCLAHGLDLHVLSPRDPEATLALARGLQQAWWRDPETRAVSLDIAGDRRIHIDDQRAVARVTNFLAGRCRDIRVRLRLEEPNRPDRPGERWLVQTEDGWRCWADTLPRREVAGVECLVDGEHLHVTRASDPGDVLLTVGAGVGQERRHDGSPARELGAAPVRGREWAAEDVRRIAAVLEALGARALAREDGGLRAAGLSQYDLNRWARFQDHATDHPYHGVVRDGRTLVWRVAPWKAALLDTKGRELFSLHGANRELHFVSATFPDIGHLRDAARLLTETGWKAGTPYLSDRWGGLRWSDVSTPDRAGTAALVPILGRWTVVTSRDELLETLRAAGRAQFRDRCATMSAILLLPAAGEDPAADQLLARHLAAWAASADRDVLAIPTSLGILSFHRPGAIRRNVAERLREAASLMPLMLASERKAVGRAAELRIRGLMGRSRRPRGLTAPGDVREAVAAFWPLLSDRLLERSVPWALHFGDLTVGTGDARRLETVWLDIDDAVGGRLPQVRQAIDKAARSSMWALETRPAELGPRDLAEAENWLRCGRAALRGWWKGAVEKGMVAIEAIALARLAEDPAGWEAVAKVARALASEAADGDRQAGMARAEADIRVA